MPRVNVDKTKLDALANVISAKSGESIPLTLDEMADAVDNISGGSPNLQSKTASYTPTTSQQTDTITADVGYDGIDTVDITIDAVQTAEHAVPFIAIGMNTGIISATHTQAEGYVPAGTTSATLQMSTQGATTITPTESQQTAVAANKYTTGAVTVGAISSSYVGSGIDRNDSTDLSASGATVTAPAGYYANSASKSVASGTEGTPTATKGSVSNHAVTVTPSVTNSGGYIQGGTHTGTAVSVSASELVSGTYNITSSGTKDVTNYASASVPAGTVTAPSTISGTSATVSTSTNTLTLSKTVSVTPNVSTAGYISSGTAGNANVSLSANVTTQGAQTIYPSTSDQTINSGRYLTGNQTIKGVAVSNTLIASNIKSGVTVTIGDSADADRVMSVTGTYSGGGGATKNIQVNSDAASVRTNVYTSTGITLTVAKTGTYNISWMAWRSSSQGAMGTNLHIGNTAGTNQQTWTNTYGQHIVLENQSLTQGTVLTLYANAGSNSRYCWAGNLIIEEQ